MYDITKLKSKTTNTENKIECPVKGCKETVSRQKKRFKRLPEFLCDKHQIYISPSTFEYKKETENLLWFSELDIEYLDQIKKFKRESRMAREKSEDAVTFNVFRYLQNNELLGSFLESVTAEKISNLELILWSFSEREKKGYKLLEDARHEFGEAKSRGSEPDIIIDTDNILFFIEAKFSSPNKTIPSDPDPEKTKKYLTGGNNWFDQVFKEKYKKIAFDEKKYELLRLWLLGTWMAKKQSKKFFLINLVLQKRDSKIEEQFKPCINEDENQQFKRIEWESIYNFIKLRAIKSEDYLRMTQYFENKSLGYDSAGRLKKAFEIKDHNSINSKKVI